MAKRRSAKQRANDKKLGRMAKARARKSTPKRRKVTKSRKPNKARKRRTTMVKRRRSPSKRSGGKIIDKIPLLKNKTVQRIGFGLGMGTLAGLIVSQIPVPAIQQQSQLIKTGITFATDPLAGVVSLVLGGGLGNISQLFGGGNGASTQTVGTGFA